ncbi:MAG: sensor histidine kinase [Steroidobacteraceae bacterium]
MKRISDLWLRPSLFRRLYACAIGALVLLLLVQGFYGYTRLMRADGETVAEELGQTARAYAELFSTPGLEPDTLAEQARRLAAIKISMTPLSMSADEFIYSVWASDGRLLTHSKHGAPLAKPPSVDRLHLVQVAGDVWRAYATVSADGRITAVVAQPQRLYRRFATSLLKDAGRVTLVAAIVLVVLVGVTTRAGLAPLRRVAALVQQRDPRDLSPLAVRTRYLELFPLIDAINSLFARMSRMLLAERAFFADAAHELRTPLAAVDAQAYVLAHASSDEERLLALAPLEQSVARAGTLLSKLLMLSRLEALEPGATCGGADLAILARERLMQLASRAIAQDVELSYDGSQQAVTPLDAEAAISVLDNLLDNALRHTPEGGRIGVRIDTLRHADGASWVRMTVSDTGTGVPPHERERAFDRFYRVPGTSGDGSGLGLAIVRRIVELNGGRIHIEDSFGGGAAFILELPTLSAF